MIRGNSKIIEVVLVNGKDEIIGYKEKYEAHKNPVPLHRAISVIIFDRKGKKMLLQKRAKGKPTWPLYWSNTCCTHPMEGESYHSCAKRRLKEEMGIKTLLKESFRFTYKANYDKTWGENEYDVVYSGNYTGEIRPDPQEAAGYKWISLKDLAKDVGRSPEKYTPWFKIILHELEVI